ncbi:MAG: hypothetical protein ACE5FN_00990 [Leptospirillia bacterium]
MGRAVALLIAFTFFLSVGCAGDGAFMNASFGKPKASGIFVVKQKPERRFDYVVHMANSDAALYRKEERIRRVRLHMMERCPVASVVDLYVHQVGTWPDGRERLSFTLGVNCAKAGTNGVSDK